MAEIILRCKGSIGIMVEAEVIRPDLFAGKKKEEIEELLVWQGPKPLPLSEFFDVDVSRANPSETRPEEANILIEGDVSRVKRIGQGMLAGRIEICGSAGMHLGNRDGRRQHLGAGRCRILGRHGDVRRKVAHSGQWS